MERIKREENIEASVTCLSGIKEIFISMPLCLKLTILVFVTFPIRLLAFFQTPVIARDGMLYIQMAKQFSEGNFGGIRGYYFSLYPMLLSFVQKFIGDWELSGQLISVTMSTLTVIPVFLLGRSLYNEKMGWLSALFYITLPDFMRYAGEVLRDPTSWFFMAITLWLVWIGLQKNRPVLVGLASISGGLWALTRVEGFAMWGGLAIYAAFRKARGVSLRRRVLNVTLLILIFPLLFSPVLLSLKKHPNKMAFGQMVSFSLEYLETLRIKDPIGAMGEETYRSIPIMLRGFFELAARHRVVLVVSEIIHKLIKSANLLIVLILLGLWKRKKEGFGSSDWYLLYIFVALFVLSFIFSRQRYFFSTRHSVNLVMPLLYFAGPGLIFAAETFYRGINRFTPGWTIMKRYVFHILTLFLIMIFLAQGLSAGRSEKIDIKKIGLWLKEKGYQRAVIMGPDKFNRLAFYADGKFLEMPESFEKVIDNIHRNGVKIVVIDSCNIEQDCPGFLANWPQAGLSPLQGPKGKEGKCTIQIYRVN